jgi:hypothetical protein
MYSDDESITSSLEEDIRLEVYNDFIEADISGIKRDNPKVTRLHIDGRDFWSDDWTGENWEQLGRSMSNNNFLQDVILEHGVLDDQKMSYLFGGLTKSGTMKNLDLSNNELSADGVRSMLQFLQDADNLDSLTVQYNRNIKSEGFSLLWRALRDSRIADLCCYDCGIDSIEIDINTIPQRLTKLSLAKNQINADGCRELSKLLRGKSILKELWLSENRMDDECVSILVNALRHNTSLEDLGLYDNDDISKEGHRQLLRLVNDISSIKATLQSNHSLRQIGIYRGYHRGFLGHTDPIQRQINEATSINVKNAGNPNAAGKEKVLRTQLSSARRAALCHSQGIDIDQCNPVFYSKINPLHLPEVLSLVGRTHGFNEIHLALKSSIMMLFSTVDRITCLKQEISHHESKLEVLRNELAAAIEGSQVKLLEVEGEVSNKRRRM